MDRRVALARRLRDDLHSGIEDLLTRQDEPGLAATEERRKQLAEIGVDVIESLLQQLSRLTVDLADRGLERRHRFGQVLRLGIEILLAFRGLSELVERGKIDGAQIGNRL